MSASVDFAFSLVHAPIEQISPYFESLAADHLEVTFPERRDAKGRVGNVNDDKNASWPADFQHAHLAIPQENDGTRPSDGFRRAIKNAATSEQAARLEDQQKIQALAETDPDGLEEHLIARLEKRLEQIEDPLKIETARRVGHERVANIVSTAREDFLRLHYTWDGPVGEVRLSQLSNDPGWTVVDGPMGEILRPDWLLPLVMFCDTTIVTLQYRKPEDLPQSGIYHAEYSLFSRAGNLRRVTTTWEYSGEHARLKTYRSGRARGHDPRPLKNSDHIKFDDLQAVCNKLGAPLDLRNARSCMAGTRLIGTLEGLPARALDRSALSSARNAQRTFEAAFGMPWDFG